jgi:hypothetical protein
MATLFFVHGTGVRRQGFDETLENIRQGLAGVGRGDLKVQGVPWGVMLGTHVDSQQITDMLPPTGAMGLSLTDPEVEARLWADLLADPLYELRMAALKQPAGPVIAAPGGLIPSEALKAKLRALDLKVKAPVGGVPIETIREAARWLADGDGAPVLTEAAAAVADANDPTIVGATARAIVAYALAKSRGEVGTGPDALYLADERDALVGQVAGALSGGVMGVGDWLFNAIKRFAEAQATTFAKDRRSGVMMQASPGFGDILLSQRRGQDILELLKAEIEKIEGDVYAIGHSLGGIFLVNILSSPHRPANVKKLITVASQSPFFFACDAMDTLRPGEPLGALFTPWLNIFDRNDFLSFCAERMFRSVPDVIDFEVSSGIPFPDSHGAYWRMKKVYQRISDFLG